MIIYVIQKLVPAWASGSEQNTSVFPMLGVAGSRPQFRKPENFQKGRLQMFWPTRSNEFSRCWVMVSSGVLVKINYVPRVTSEVTESTRMWNWCPRVCPSFVLSPVVIDYVSVHSSLVIEMHVIFLVGLKEYGLGIQSLVLYWPLSKVGTGLEQQTCSSPHRLIIWACLTAWRPRTNNNIQKIEGNNNSPYYINVMVNYHYHGEIRVITR